MGVGQAGRYAWIDSALVRQDRGRPGARIDVPVEIVADGEILLTEFHVFDDGEQADPLMLLRIESGQRRRGGVPCRHSGQERIEEARLPFAMSEPWYLLLSISRVQKIYWDNGLGLLEL